MTTFDLSREIGKLIKARKPYRHADPVRKAPIAHNINIVRREMAERGVVVVR